MIPAIWGAFKTGSFWLKAAPWIALVVCLPAAFLFGQIHGEHSANAKNQAARAVANVVTIQKDGDAKEVAATERLTDTLLIDDNHKELLDAIQSAPDSAPDASRVAFGCQRLRAAGRSEASLPSVCRPQSGAQAGAH